jgi:hypothetical protein
MFGQSEPGESKWRLWTCNALIPGIPAVDIGIVVGEQPAARVVHHGREGERCRYDDVRPTAATA